jgi:hypothetical protein
LSFYILVRFSTLFTLWSCIVFFWNAKLYNSKLQW